MKRILLAAVAAVCVFSAATLVNNDKNFAAAAGEGDAVCKSACLIDAASGEVAYQYNADARMPIASMCKIMTLTLCFEAVDDGRLELDDMITVSDRAAGMGGSQVFLQSGCSYRAEQLIKSVVVGSANDSCVALAERVSGSEENFVAAMNKRAAELGCADTLFVNCTGLPKETQYSTARDVAAMFANLIKNKRYFDYSSIWLEDFVHPGDRVTSMTNTNKLIRKYQGCDGGKTGFTNEAGFCLAATAARGNMRLVSAVLGGGTSEQRFDKTSELFDYGFSNFRNLAVLDESVNLNDRYAVKMGTKENVAIRPERNCFVFCGRDEMPEITFSAEVDALRAPLAAGDRAGSIAVFRNGKEFDRVPLVCAEDVPAAGYGYNLQKIALNWNI